MVELNLSPFMHPVPTPAPSLMDTSNGHTVPC